MKINKKYLFLTSGIFIGAGLLLTTVAIALGGRPGIRLSPSGLSSAYSKEENFTLSRTKLSDFTNVDISVDSADLHIIPSDGYYLEYAVHGYGDKPDYKVQDNTFTFKQVSSPLFFVMNWGFPSWDLWEDEDEISNYYINLYVPKDALFSDSKIKSQYGDVILDHYQGDFLTIQLDCGDLSIGEAAFENCMIRNEYGDTTINACKGGSLTAVLDCGDINLNKADIKTGKIKSEYGDVELSLAPSPDQYDYDLKVEYGSIELSDAITNQTITTDDDDEYSEFTSKNGKGRMIEINCDSGDVQIND